MTAGTTIFVLIDALGWLYADGFAAGLLPYRRPLRTVLGYSSGAIPAILTGLTPAGTGHWNLFYYNPSGSRFRWLRHFEFLPERILGHRLTRKLLKECGRHVLGLGSLFECCVSPRFLPYFDWVEKKNVYAPGGISGAPSIFDSFEAKGVRYRAYSYHSGSDAELFDAVCRHLRQKRASFYFVYLSELDEFFHHHCTEPEKIQRKLTWYDGEVRKLFRLALEADPGARLAVASDHGMAPVREHFDLMGGIEDLGLAMPNDYLAVYDSTMARFWFFKQSARDAIAGYLAKQTCGRILSEEELKTEGVLFEDRRYGQTIFLLNPGCMMGRSDFNNRGWNPSGMHGFHPDDPYSSGVFLSNRDPGVLIRSITDLYGWMRWAAGA